MDLRSFLETLQSTGRGGGLFVLVLLGVFAAAGLLAFVEALVR